MPDLPVSLRTLVPSVAHAGDCAMAVADASFAAKLDIRITVKHLSRLFFFVLLVIPVLVEALLSLLQCVITAEYLQMDLTNSQERFLSDPDAADPKLPSRHS